MSFIKAFLTPQGNILIGAVAWIVAFALVYLNTKDATSAIAVASSAAFALAHFVDTYTTATSK
jgi:hypothetical protein